MKRLLILATGALAALALADGLLIGSTGNGRALAVDGRTGSFSYSALKRTASNARSTFDGGLRFEQQPNGHGPYILIEGGLPDAVSVNGNVGEFGGRAILTTLNAMNLRVRMGGRYSVRAVDRRSATSVTGDPDTFRIRFEGEKGLTFSFEGRLTSGDVIVGSRTLK